MAGYRSGSTSYKNVHYFALSGSVGYGTLLENLEEINTVGGLAGSVGFGYELRKSGFWLNTGLELQMLYASGTYNISGFDRLAYDTQGKKMLYHYDFEQSADNQRFLLANIPIMVGYYYMGFYMGAGAKVGYALTARESTAVRYSTTGTYTQYVEDFEGMENHFYSTYDAKATENLRPIPKVSVIAELGYDLLAWARMSNLTEHHGLKIGAYVEYGLTNIVGTTSERELYTVDNSNASQLHLTPFYNANSAYAHRVIPFYAGVRISWIFCIPTKHCDCNVSENQRNFTRRFKNIQH